MNTFIRVWLLASVCAAVALCVGCGRRASMITMAGSTAFQPFAEKLADRYMAVHKGVNITVQGGGSAAGIQSAISGAAQIGMADLVTLPAEAKALNAVVVARDGIAVVVNPASTVTNLSIDQVRGIFGGTVKNWKDVGGRDGPITVVSREAGSGTRSSFEQILGGIDLSRDAIVQDSNGTIRETVANDANAVGYLSHGLINEKIKPVTVDDRACTTDEIMAGTYKLVRPIFLLTKQPPTDTETAFLAYILSAEGQGIIQKSGLIPAK